MLYFVGLGLGDERDITLRGLEAVRSCARVYLESYTSLLACDTARLEALYGKSIVVADREFVEERAESEILANADAENVALLVVGDVFGATTHHDLWLRARQLSIPCDVVHNASIMNAVGACGLQLYRFGETVSLVLFTDTWRPDSFYERVARNQRAGLHTLCLLDIKVREPTLESLARGKKVYDEPRFMTVNVALQQLLQVADARRQPSEAPDERMGGAGDPVGDIDADTADATNEQQQRRPAYDSDTLCIGLARVGQPDQQIVAGTMQELLGVDFGRPLHSLVIPGDMHPLEREMVDAFRIRDDARA